MNSKRWIALVVVIALIVVSFGVSITTQLTSNLVDDMWALNPDTYDEEVIIDGNRDERIAVLELTGTIMNDGMARLQGDGYSHHRMITTIEQAAFDPTVKAVLLVIDSPGGAVGETAEIHRALSEMQKEYDKPIYVAMQGMAASGGYYAAAPADKIYAQPSTLTGSIGVIMESINFSGLAEKYGVSFDTIKSGKHKDIMSPSREMTMEEEEILQSIIDEMYDEFVKVIVEGRSLPEKEVREIGDGRIYSGKQAKEVGLVDEIGSYEDALEDLEETYQLTNPEVIHYVEDLPFLFAYLNSFGVNMKNLWKQEDNELEIIMGLLRQSDKPQAMYIY